MKAKKLSQKFLLALGHVMPGMIFLLLAHDARANPTGMVVQSGGAAPPVQNGSQMTINVSKNNTVLNWSSFNIAAGETTIFNQPSASSVVWNNIGGNSASQIYGSLQANGIVVLLNSSGFNFGPNSFVSAAGLVVSTANCLPPQNSGGAWTFNGPPPLQKIVNYGQIQVGQSGFCYLIADKVENHGEIETPGGSVGLAAGKTIILSERPDGRGMSMKVTLPQGSVDNYGTLLADGGTISLNAKAVNQDGFIQANSVKNVNGVIELVASDQLTLGADSKLAANGDSSATGSHGGQIMLQTDNTYADDPASQIQVNGGANGGDAGRVLIYADASTVQSQLQGTAQPGFAGGQTYYYPVADSLTLDSSSLAPFAGFSSILFRATGDITLNPFTSWNLSGSTGPNLGQLILQAGGNITLYDGVSIADANGWNISLSAGMTDLANHTVTSGTGSILVDSPDGDPNSFIQTTSGSIELVAGQDITLGLGYVNTTGGGEINATALGGSINTGSIDQGYFVQQADTTDQGVVVGPFIGGISTLGGGNINLTAGQNITSLLPTTAVSDQNLVGTAGVGAYGNQAGQSGDVTIIAGGDVTGHYLVANGKGKIVAGGSAGTDTKHNGLALSVVSDFSTGADGWDVTAGQDIYLQEVRNPNGLFNTLSGGAHHLFDYGPGDYVRLTAGNSVVLGSTLLPRDNSDGLIVPEIFPSILNITAGAGGVDFAGNLTQLILFPSPQGSLVINTTDGGSLFSTLPTSGGTPQVFNLIVSDSASQQYVSSASFGSLDHATAPIHYKHPTLVQLNISGDMNLVNLVAPEAAQINVVGNIYNSRFQGMNLTGTDTTSIDVGQTAKINMENSGILNSATDGGLTIGGNIENRSSFTSVILTSGEPAPNLALLADATGNTINGIAISAAKLLSSFFFAPAPKGSTGKTGTLTYQDISLPGVTLSGVLDLLQSLTIQKRDSAGGLVTDANGNPVLVQVSVINPATAAALQAEYDSLNNSIGPNPGAQGGFVLGGGGTFAIHAANMDLGTTAGIQSQGVGLYTVGSIYPLATYFNQGANIAVDLTGDLTMYSSAIASYNGGSITINAGGDLNVGSSDFNVSSTVAHGIFTSDHADVVVTAAGDINVNGSRIAAYDGGNVTVESLHGDINAGSGGSGFAVVKSYFVDPKTHAVQALSPTIPGSGILTTTFPTDPLQVIGNILVETPEGSIVASSGGVIQLPLNKNNDNSKAVVEVLAGYELRDASGHAVTAAHLADGTAVKVTDGENIDASGSGIIGENVVAEATGTFKGVVFGQNNVSLTSPKLTDLTVLGQTVQTEGSLGPTVTLIGTESVSTGGASGGATILSQNANGGGSSFAQGTAANATSSAASANDAAAATTAAKSDAGNGDDQVRNKKPITLARKVSRVTVLLPGKN